MNPNKVFIICEGGLTNYGDIDLAKKQIDAAYDAKADAIKFQAWRTEDLISKKVAKRLEPELGYDWFERVKYKEFSGDQLKELQQYANAKGITFFATPHDDWGLDFLDKELNIPLFKIGSGEAHNFEFLKNVGSRKKPVIISFGLQSDEEIVKAVKILKDSGAPEITALHCVTTYPVPYDMISLPRIAHLQKLLKIPIGISDHSIGRHVILAGVALGASAIEKHLTFDKTDPRSLDNPGALLPEEFKELVKEVRDLEKALVRVPENEREKFLEKGRDWAGQSIVANEYLPLGTVIQKSHLAFKRPKKGGLDPASIDLILGKKTKVAIEADEQIKWEFLI